MKTVITISMLLMLLVACSEMEMKWVKEFKPAGPGSYSIASIVQGQKGFYVTGLYWTKDKRYTCITAGYKDNGRLEWYKLYSPDNTVRTEGQSVDLTEEKSELIKGPTVIYVHAQITDRAFKRNSVLITYDRLGTPTGEHTIAKSPDEDELESMMLTDYKGNIYIAGQRINAKDSTSVFITKFDRSGTVVWSTQYYNPDVQFLHMQCDITKPDVFVVSGINLLTHELQFLKFNSSGQMVNLTTCVLAAQVLELADAKIDEEGNLYLLARSTGKTKGHDWLIVMYDRNNNQVWAKRFEGTAQQYVRPVTMIVDKRVDSTALYVFGVTLNTNGTTAIVAVRYNQDGMAVWVKRFQDRAHKEVMPRLVYPGLAPARYFTKIKESTPREFFVAGSDEDNVVIVKYNSSGVIPWSLYYTRQGSANTPKALTSDYMAFQSDPRWMNKSRAFVLKYGKTAQLGISRWD